MLCVVNGAGRRRSSGAEHRTLSIGEIGDRMDLALKTSSGTSSMARPAASRPGAPRLERSDAVPGDTIAQKFWNAVQLRGDRIALRQKELGIWEEVSWRTFGAHARAIAMAIAREGLQPGDTASILSNTRREWSYADYGILMAGGVSSGIYPTD